MAFDTRNKRFTALSALSTLAVVMPEPSGAFDTAAERLQLLKLLGDLTADVGEPTVFHKAMGHLPHHTTPGQLPHHKATDDG